MDVKTYPHIGQFYIYTLQITELFLDGILKYPELEDKITEVINKDMTIEDFYDEFVKQMKKDTRATDINEIIKNSKNTFSYTMLCKIMLNQNTHEVLSKYLNTYFEKFEKIEKDVYRVEFDYNERVDKDINEFKKKTEDEYKDRMHLVYHAEDLVERHRNTDKLEIKNVTVMKNLPTLVKFTTQDSGFFDNRIFLYYLFFKWHIIDDNSLEKIKKAAEEKIKEAEKEIKEAEEKIKKAAEEKIKKAAEEIKKANIILDHVNDLTTIKYKLISTNISVDHKEAKELIDEYFIYYAELISNITVIEALQYSPYNYVDYLIKHETVYSLFNDLCYVFKNSFSLTPLPEGTSIYQSYLRNETKQKTQKALYHYPQLDDSSDWMGAFEKSFPNLKDQKTLSRLLAMINADDYTNKEQYYEEMKLALTEASLIPENTKTYYNDAETVECEGIRFKIPYIPILNSSSKHNYDYSNFEFIPNRECTAPKPDIDVFDQLKVMEKLTFNAKEKARRASQDIISERKIYIYDTVIQPDSERFTMKLGKIDYFTGVSRRDFFIDYLKPRSINISKLILELLEENLLEKFLTKNKNAIDLSSRFIKEHNSIKAILEFNNKNTEDPSQNTLKKIIDNIRSSMEKKLHSMYDINVVQNLKKNENGNFEIGNTGTTYTGCGTFVIAMEHGIDGKKRPWLLLERRWKVSEKSDSLCYSSAGGCDMYDPDDFAGLAKKAHKKYNAISESEKIDEYIFKYDHEKLFDLEASPFLTATRELKDELRIKIKPEQLKFVSLGIDSTRSLQQFSFLYETDQSVEDILERASIARNSEEGKTFIIPFKKDIILYILNNYKIEPGALYSLVKILELRKDLLWE